MSWEPSHSFGFDGGDNLNAGIDEDLLEVGHYTAADVEAGRRPDAGRGGLIDADPRLGKCGRHLPERDAEPDLPVVASPAKGLRSSRATPVLAAAAGHGVAGGLLRDPAGLAVLDLPAVAGQRQPRRRLLLQLGLRQLHRGARAATASSSCARSCTPGTATLLALADRLPAGLLHRLQVRQVQGAAAGAGRRAVLRLLPDPHLRVEDDPGRRGLHRADDERPEPAARRTGSSTPRSRWSRASRTTSCPS